MNLVYLKIVDISNIYFFKLIWHLYAFQLYDLPLEMLDIILQKSYLHWILNSPTQQTDEEVIKSLISVDVCFNRRITRQRFKRITWHYLKGKVLSKHYFPTSYLRPHAIILIE